MKPASWDVRFDCVCGGYVRIDANAVVWQSHSGACLLVVMPEKAWLAIPERRKASA